MADYVELRLGSPPAFTGDPDAWAQAINRWLVDINRTYSRLLTRGLRWQNLRSNLISHTFNATPDTADTITHNLGKIPEIYLIAGVQAAAGPGNHLVYHTSTDKTNWTETTIDLRCNAASVVTDILVM